MAKPPPEDPRVTDLRRYKQAREKAARKAPPKRRAPGQSFLGSNPRAGLILVLVILALVVLYLGPQLLALRP